jgi:hypothetical protein
MLRWGHSARPEPYSQLLADIYHRAKHSGHPAADTISEGCITSFMPPSGDGGRTVMHWGEQDPKTGPPTAPMVINGIDVTETQRVAVERLHVLGTEQDIGDAEYQRRLEEAGRRSVEPPTS